ncbi:MAG: trehalase-like domain-containing protein [Acidiferrobacteraceae bacterium]
MTAPIKDCAIDDQKGWHSLSDRFVDWLCWPRFDSSACFSALLGDKENGRRKLAPLDTSATINRGYQTDALILETDFETSTGAVRIIDFMPMRDQHSVLVRIVEGLRGTVALESDLMIRFDNVLNAIGVHPTDKCIP